MRTHNGTSWQNMSLLHELVRNRSSRPSPGPQDLVVHLRLGDVLDNPFYAAKGCTLHTNTTDCPYVKPLHAYARLSLPRTVARAYLVGSPHYRARTALKSLEYVRRVRATLAERGVRNIVELLNRDADEDLTFMARATYFVPSGGGFSSTVAELVRMNGGRVLWLQRR